MIKEGVLTGWSYLLTFDPIQLTSTHSNMEISALPIEGYYHICSDGNYSAILFRNEPDFKAAMNRIAVCTLRFDIAILAFVLMDNHFHFVVHCTSDDTCRAYVNEFKRLTGKYNYDTYGESATLSRLPVKVIPVNDADYLRTLIGYVVKNPTKARIGMFYDYPWGTGGLYFRKTMVSSIYPSMRLGSLHDCDVRRICKSRVKLPPGWIIADGIILPENYVDIDAVENLFKSTRSYMYFLSMNKDTDIERDMGDWAEVCMNDSELRAERILLCRDLFGTTSLRKVPAPDRLKLARRLRRKFGCSKKQLARIVQLPLSTIERFLS